MKTTGIPSSLSGVMNSSVLGKLAAQRDLLIVLGVVGILIVMVIPIPTILMDLLLSLNLCLALIILLVSMYNKEALEFSVFPSLLLTVTLFRLSLNVATTRLILSQADAGQVVRVFGQFVTRGNMVVGFIIFLILVIIQFVVITKGAGRIAEVAARFTLDAMPGKQMAIDADLNAGLINEEQARNRRTQIAREADFYGAMDGASKFVRGDAIAGILITIINVIGGFIIGVAQMNLGFAESLSVYTMLTIGDGLVSQIPALMISTGAGILVSRAASQNDLGHEITHQLFSKPKVLGVAGGMMWFFAAIPGFPKIPFIVLGAISLSVAYIGYQRNKEEQKKLQEPQVENEPQEERVEDYLHVDPMELEIGYGLIPLVDAKQGGDLLDRITMIRRQLATELGIIIPPVRIRDNIQIKASEYRVKIRTIEVGKGELMSGAYLAMDSGTVTKKIRGVQTIEPAFGLPALWITESQKEDAELNGYTVVELPAVLATHLTEVIKRHGHELLTRQDVRTLIDNVKEHSATVVEELIPGLMSIGDIHKVLQNLLREKVSIRDLVLILETLANVAPKSKNPDILTEYVRNALAAQICETCKSEDGIVPVITLDPNLEAQLEGAIQETDGGIRFALSPSDVNRIISALTEQVESVRKTGELPIVICSPTIRIQLKRLTETSHPDLIVLSYNEIVPGIEIRSMGMITLDGK
ncbi:flagellar biosynthesis protein FlhA [Chitinispirillales bacterium ANBcel5]|uniref:flagellar biosynthesis protein FlhA n=1 Tax=Cellulosispirillum alkaliphilum TaxID=3039283 RepID=UPI002A4F9F25|nr:flagellar biosynthesis protein FlhA [Chitinispirillales bacterium ANBcel5]